MRKVYFIDLFCGAGGTSTGVHKAKYMGEHFAEVLCCVNHDAMAIASHKENHPGTLHYTEDIRVLDISHIAKLVNYKRKREPECIIILWASLECTNFSKAKGGQPRDADSRTLAEHLFRYIEDLKPDSVWIENVEEFMSWGPLDDNGKPVSKKSGSDYMRWTNQVCSYGYTYDYRILNSADYGAFTSRKRFFGQFNSPDVPTVWPAATHSKSPVQDMFTDLQPWNAVKHCLDFSNEGKSIFGRKKDLSEKTLERIYAGLIKYVAGGKEAFMIKWNSYNIQSGARHCSHDLENPSPVVSTQNRLGVVNASFLAKYYSGKPENKCISVDGPAGALTTIDSHSLVNAEYLMKYHGHGENVHSIEAPSTTLSTKDRLAKVKPCFFVNYHHSSVVNSVDDPCPTITTHDKYGLIQPEHFLDKTYSGKDNHQSIEQPAGVVMPNDKHQLVKVKYCFIDKQFSQGGKHQSINAPSSALLTVPKMNLVTCKPWVMNTNFNNVGSSIEDPAPTITANRKWHYLMNPQWGGNPGDVEKPAFTLIARMDKAPPYLISTETGQIAIQVYDTDSPAMIKIKEFMAMYGIVDIKMRMLVVDELLKIQGFPEDYVLLGSQADKKKFIGNSVVPHVVTAMCEAMYVELLNRVAA